MLSTSKAVLGVRHLQDRVVDVGRGIQSINVLFPVGHVQRGSAGPGAVPTLRHGDGASRDPQGAPRRTSPRLLLPPLAGPRQIRHAADQQRARGPAHRQAAAAERTLQQYRHGAYEEHGGGGGSGTDRAAIPVATTFGSQSNVVIETLDLCPGHTRAAAACGGAGRGDRRAPEKNQRAADLAGVSWWLWSHGPLRNNQDSAETH